MLNCETVSGIALCYTWNVHELCSLVSLYTHILHNVRFTILYLSDDGSSWKKLTREIV